uniref:Uncharacterized protein n=1 Tax=uncultured Armatimonadetes bacterium TaxID=157466 RepID=A0A6J4K1V9_9BACT|nr:hypothetical protein AVDCRST_MAG63-4566 [uncultured Armatimonadetes bacterium]
MPGRITGTARARGEMKSARRRRGRGSKAASPRSPIAPVPALCRVPRRCHRGAAETRVGRSPRYDRMLFCLPLHDIFGNLRDLPAV